MSGEEAAIRPRRNGDSEEKSPPVSSFFDNVFSTSLSPPRGREVPNPPHMEQITKVGRFRSNFKDDIEDRSLNVLNFLKSLLTCPKPGSARYFYLSIDV
jgi:hypothetical protein